MRDIADRVEANRQQTVTESRPEELAAIDTESDGYFMAPLSQVRVAGDQARIETEEYLQSDTIIHLAEVN